jgi:hypothetical protein
LASAGAVPVVLASSENAGLASKTSEAVISTIFFIVSSIAEKMLYNARPEQTFQIYFWRIESRKPRGGLRR